MIHISTKMRIVLGLASMLTSVLLLAIVLGIIPDRRTAVTDGRASLCEALAVTSSVLVSQRDVGSLEAILRAVVRRNGDILSAAVRREDGQLIAEVGPHAGHWRDLSGEHSVDSQVYVPIRDGAEKWGGVEVRFRPMTRHQQGALSYLANPWVRLIVFVVGTCFVLWFFYLGKMFQHLDPSKVVPGRVRSALDTLAEGLLVLDNRERIVLANQAFAAWVGQPPDQLIGRRASALPWKVVDGAGPDTSFPWLRTFNGNGRQEGAMMQLKEDMCGERTFMVNCSPVLGQDGKHRGILVSFEDVTQLEQTKVELGKSRDAAQEANAAKSEFLARMSHEIRTPMNAILGFTDVLLRGFAENESQRSDYLNTIHASGTHLLDLINDILDLSKIEAGRMEVQPVRCSPYELIHQAVTALQVRAEEKGITLEIVATRIPETIMTDALRFRQVLTNLVGNAIKFTETGGVTVVARLDESSGTSQLAVDVIDTGMGMSSQALARIFDPFAQADKSITSQFGGTGLGLSISRRLAKALGGGVSVTSKEGQGSVFTVTFDTGPLEGVSLLDSEVPDVRARPVAKIDRATPELPPGRVLVVDDGEANRKLMELVLGRGGMEVETAINGKAAVEQATQSEFDAIVMDMQMPVMDGYTATSILRQQGLAIPIIALTADAMKGSEEKCRAAGCSSFLTKPIDMDLLISTMATSMSGGRAREGTGSNGGPRTEKQMPSHNGLGESAALAVPPGKPPERSPEEEIGAAVAEIGDLARTAGGQDPRWSAGDIETDSAGPFRRTVTRAAASPSQPPPDAGPLVSSLPTDDPEFREIVVGWVGRLQEQLNAMHGAMAQRDLAELAQLAHWLKGSGETMGFRAFSAPAAELERLSKARDEDRIADVLAVLVGLSERIVVPEDEGVPASTAP